AVILFCTFLYLVDLLRFGVVAETTELGAKIPRARRVFAGIFFVSAVYCIWGLSGRPINPVVGAFLPPPGYGVAQAATPSDELPWLSDYQTALARARAEHKPLLIDFTGYTCT